MADDAVRIDWIRSVLRSGSIGNEILYFPVIDSTNRALQDLPSERLKHGTVALAEHQQAGRGRVGRAWVAPPRSSILMSVVLDVPAAGPPAGLVMAVSLAVQSALNDTCRVTSTLKWPNDVLIGPGKVCGMLLESSYGKAIAGIGVNVNFEPAHMEGIPPSATSLSAETGQMVDRSSLVVALCASLELWYRCLTREPDGVFAAWRANLQTLGREVIVRQASTCTRALALDVQPDGGLVLGAENGSRHVVYAGDVSILTPPEVPLQ